MKTTRYIILIGDILFALWILYNGIDEGFRDILNIQGIVPLGLMVLLVLNALVVWKQK